jgi:hypothetical protein
MNGGSTGSNSAVQQVFQDALKSAGVKSNASNGQQPSAANTPASSSTGCTNETLASGTTAARQDGVNYFYSAEETANGKSAGQYGLCGAGWGPDKSKIAQCVSNSLYGGSTGHCAAGVMDTLTAMGYPAPARGASNDAYKWAPDPKTGVTRMSPSMEQMGYKAIDCQPTTCPPGAVLVYGRDADFGRSARNGGGGTYGHVEIVTEVNGKRQYVSDYVSDNYGGTVCRNGAQPCNFLKAYVYEGPPPKQPSDVAKQCAAKVGAGK